MGLSSVSEQRSHALKPALWLTGDLKMLLRDFCWLSGCQRLLPWRARLSRRGRRERCRDLGGTQPAECKNAVSALTTFPGRVWSLPFKRSASQDCVLLFRFCHSAEGSLGGWGETGRFCLWKSRLLFVLLRVIETSSLHHGRRFPGFISVAAARAESKRGRRKDRAVGRNQSYQWEASPAGQQRKARIWIRPQNLSAENHQLNCTRENHSVDRTQPGTEWIRIPKRCDDFFFHQNIPVTCSFIYKKTTNFYLH